MRLRIGLILFLGQICSWQLVAGQVLTPASAETVLQAVRSSHAKVKVVNMWATWCGPCVEEFPDIVRLGHQYAKQGLEVFFVSTDFEEEESAANAFVKRQGWAEPSFIKAEKDDAFINAFSKDWSGAVPSTFIYDSTGNLSIFWEGKVTYDQLVERVSPLLGERVTK